MNDHNLTFFIDLDGTVYNKKNGMLDEMLSRIDVYLHEVVGIPKNKVSPTRDEYYDKYGSTVRGVQLHHEEINSEDFLAYIHDLDLSKYLTKDPNLRASLEAIPYPKWVFTNSDRNHAQRVLHAIGIEDLFEGILDVWAMDYIPKPHRWTYLQARSLTGNPLPQNCVFVDDTCKNLAPAQQMGWHTVWIDGFTPHPHASFSIPNLSLLPYALDKISANSWLKQVISMPPQAPAHQMASRNLP